MLIMISQYCSLILLLKERFGQPHKLTHAHMQALLNLPTSLNELSSLHSFNDSIETHIRALSSLGVPQDSYDSYGTLLVPIIVGKLPPKTWRNLHMGIEWTIDKLKSVVSREIRILETGLYTTDQSTNTINSPRATASFLEEYSLLPLWMQTVRKNVLCVISLPHHL